jgi:oryzin
MQLFARIFALAVAVVPFLAQAAPIATRSPEDVLAGQYIVQLMPDADIASITAHHKKVRSIRRRDDLNVSVSIDQEYNFGDFKGYSGLFDPAVIAELEAMPEVLLVEKDYMMYTTALLTRTYTMDSNSQPKCLHLENTLLTTSETSAPWGLGRVSSKAKGATSYIYDSTAGSGTYSYVVDSGIRTTHAEFEGRASWGYNAIDTVNTDVFGHGTHTAGIIGAKTYGVAKKTNLIAVKVFSDGNAPTSVILGGFNWAVNDIIAKGRQTSAVINLSLGGPASSTWDNAIASASRQGILAVASAGNDNQLAENTSPCRAAGALCVGSVQSNDSRSYFSNYGSGVDIWAPGTDIPSTWHTSDTATSTQSGTSASAPYVAGLVSYIHGLEGLSIGPAARARILALATYVPTLCTFDPASGQYVCPAPGQLTDAGGPNLLAYNGNGR